MLYFMLFCYLRICFTYRWTCIIADGAEAESDYSGGDLSLRSMEFDPCIETDELKWVSNFSHWKIEYCNDWLPAFCLYICNCMVTRVIFFFRISVGTWNVAGRTPIGSLEVDLEDWLSLRNAADLYVLGYAKMKYLSHRSFNYKKLIKE